MIPANIRHLPIPQIIEALFDDANEGRKDHEYDTMTEYPLPTHTQREYPPIEAQAGEKHVVWECGIPFKPVVV